MRLVLLISVLLLSSCSLKKFYPLAGSVLGGSAGAIGGPITGGLGAGAGWTVGELARDDESLEEANAEIAEAQETIRALTTGDVQALVDAEMQKQQGFMAKLEDGIYNILKIVGLLVALMVSIGLIYTRLKCRKTLEILGLKNEDLGTVQRGSK
jgi:hypothetical protein